MMCFNHRWVQLGRSSTAGGANDGRMASRQRKPKGEEPCTALIEADVDPQISAGACGQGEG
jgi:hypothetical protein